MGIGWSRFATWTLQGSLSSRPIDKDNILNFRCSLAIAAAITGILV